MYEHRRAAPHNKYSAAALVYRPREVIVTFPARQTLTRSGTPLELTAGRLRLRLDLFSDGALGAATLEGTDVTLPFGGTAERALAALRLREGAEYDAYLELGRTEIGPDTLGAARIDGVVTLSAPLAPESAAEALSVRDVVIRSARGDWNGAAVEGSGRLGSDLELSGPGAEALRPFLNALGG